MKKVTLRSCNEPTIAGCVSGFARGDVFGNKLTHD